MWSHLHALVGTKEYFFVGRVRVPLTGKETPGHHLHHVRGSAGRHVTKFGPWEDGTKKR